MAKFTGGGHCRVYIASISNDDVLHNVGISLSGRGGGGGGVFLYFVFAWGGRCYASRFPISIEICPHFYVIVQ